MYRVISGLHAKLWHYLAQLWRQERVQRAAAADLRPACTEFVEHVCRWEERLRLCPASEVQLRYTSRDELPDEVTDGRELPCLEDDVVGAEAAEPEASPEADE